MSVETNCGRIRLLVDPAGNAGADGHTSQKVERALGASRGTRGRRIGYRRCDGEASWVAGAACVLRCGCRRSRGVPNWSR